MARTARDDDISGRKRIHERLEKIFEDIEKGFENQISRADETRDFWDAYQCVLSGKQFYNGNSKIYVPIIQVALRARAVRFVNQMFPQNGRYVDITGAADDEAPPLEVAALLEKYVKDARLRTQIAAALSICGDIEGQYNLYVGWKTVERHVVSRQSVPVRIGNVDMPEAGEIDKLVAETITDEGLDCEVLHDSDVLVWPATVDTIEQALEVGGGVAIVRRWTKDKIKQLRDDKEIVPEAATKLLAAMGKLNDQRKDPRKPISTVSGIRIEEGSKVAVVLEVWTKLKVDGERRICRAYLCSEPKVLGCKLNPYWCDLVPLLSAPVNKIAGLFKGLSLVKPGVLDLQVQANDALNMAMDGLPYHMAPVMAVNPEQVARWESLVLDVGAVWPVPPDAIKQMQYTDVTGSALQVVGAAKSQIFEALSVNPSMVPQQTGKHGAKRNQAEVALEQQVDILTSSDAAQNIEDEILTPTLVRAYEYDQQFRTQDTRVAVYGSLGHRASMVVIPPMQRNQRYHIRWLGVEAARDAARIQQQIAFFGVLQKFPAQLYQGHRLNAIPMITRAVETIFGATLGSQIFENVSALYTIAPDEENAMMEQSIIVKVHPLDEDPQHIQAHMAAMQDAMLDPSAQALLRDHIQAHQMQMQMKAMAAMQQRGGGGGQPPQQIGGPPGGGRGPQPGAQPQGPRPNRGPAGSIPQDQMPRAGALTMPRKT